MNEKNEIKLKNFIKKEIIKEDVIKEEVIKEDVIKKKDIKEKFIKEKLIKEELKFIKSFEFVNKEESKNELKNQFKNQFKNEFKNEFNELQKKENKKKQDNQIIKNYKSFLIKLINILYKYFIYFEKNEIQCNLLDYFYILVYEIDKNLIYNEKIYNLIIKFEKIIINSKRSLYVFRIDYEDLLIIINDFIFINF